MLLKRVKPNLIFGVFFILLSILANEWVLARIFSPDDGRIISTIFRLSIFLVQCYFFIMGIYLVKNHKQPVIKTVLKFFGLFGFLCLFVICADFAILGFKIMIRVALTPQMHVVEDEKLGWKLKSNLKILSDDGRVLLETDNQGHRKTDDVTDSGAMSIYFFGDSFTYGFGVSNEETFTNIIANTYLNDIINVHNMAVAGYGLPQIYQMFLGIENNIKPNDIVVMCPITHDIDRTYQNFGFMALISLLSKTKIKTLPIFENGTLRTQSMESLYSLYNKIKIICISAPGFGKLYARIFNIKPKESYDPIGDAKEMFKQIKYKTEQRGGKFVLFFLPCLREREINKYLVDISDIDYIDLLDDFPESNKELISLYNSRDKHYSPKGHRFVAQLLIKYLINEDILDAEHIQTQDF